MTDARKVSIWIAALLTIGIAVNLLAITKAAAADTSCLPSSIRAKIATIPMRKIIATRAARANKSYHPSCRAIDFIPKSYAQAMSALRNWPGTVITYSGKLHHIHIDNGPRGRYHKRA